MTPPKKPDWMEIADGDEEPKTPPVIKKQSRPLVVAGTLVAVVFGGALYAQTNNGSKDDVPAIQQASTQNSVQSSNESSASANQSTKKGSGSLPTSQNLKSSDTANQPVTANQPSIATPTKKPAIATPPNMNSGREDDEREGDHDGFFGFFGHDRDEHEEDDD